ncbi:MAG: hypothetical protein KGQ89_06605 [Verrucomicrobia bacterium]|nr:hypothetical protein [Verrucomicrobiota bacterium]
MADRATGIMRPRIFFNAFISDTAVLRHDKVEIKANKCWEYCCGFLVVLLPRNAETNMMKSFVARG